MEILFELILRILGELVLQIVIEVLAEFGFRSLAAPFKKKPNPVLAGLGYLIFGALAGAISLLFLPTLLLGSNHGQMANLIVTPLIAGSVMAALGTWRLRREQELIRLDRFVYGYLFALSMALVRFYFGG